MFDNIDPATFSMILDLKNQNMIFKHFITLLIIHFHLFDFPDFTKNHFKFLKCPNLKMNLNRLLCYYHLY
jgi:hypothetical protein